MIDVNSSKGIFRDRNARIIDKLKLTEKLIIPITKMPKIPHKTTKIGLKKQGYYTTEVLSRMVESSNKVAILINCWSESEAIQSLSVA